MRLILKQQELGIVLLPQRQMILPYFCTELESLQRFPSCTIFPPTTTTPGYQHCRDGHAYLIDDLSNPQNPHLFQEK